jgi:hypothetical protein
MDESTTVMTLGKASSFKASGDTVPRVKSKLEVNQISTYVNLYRVRRTPSVDPQRPTEVP